MKPKRKAAEKVVIEVTEKEVENSKNHNIKKSRKALELKDDAVVGDHIVSGNIGAVPENPVVDVAIFKKPRDDRKALKVVGRSVTKYQLPISSNAVNGNEEMATKTDTKTIEGNIEKDSGDRTSRRGRKKLNRDPQFPPTAKSLESILPTILNEIIETNPEIESDDGKKKTKQKKNRKKLYNDALLGDDGDHIASKNQDQWKPIVDKNMEKLELDDKKKKSKKDKKLENIFVDNSVPSLIDDTNASNLVPKKKVRRGKQAVVEEAQLTGAPDNFEDIKQSDDAENLVDALDDGEKKPLKKRAKKQQQVDVTDKADLVNTTFTVSEQQKADDIGESGCNDNEINTMKSKHAKTQRLPISEPKKVAKTEVVFSNKNDNADVEINDKEVVDKSEEQVMMPEKKSKRGRKRQDDAADAQNTVVDNGSTAVADTHDDVDVTKAKKHRRGKAVVIAAQDSATTIADENYQAKVESLSSSSELDVINVNKKKSGKSNKKVVGEEVEELPTKSIKKTIVLKTKAPVDSECVEKLDKAHVYCEGHDIYDVMLNQTNINENNNKYYIIQLLEDDNSKQYSVWLRWGRVGYAGQRDLKHCGTNLDQAKQIFCSKFREKTKNDWSMRDNFHKVQGKYDLITLDHAPSNDDRKKIDDDQTQTTATNADKEPKLKKKQLKIDKQLSVVVAQEEPIESELDKRIQDLLTLICDVEAMEQTVVDMEYDANKAPLGKLSANQIKAGYQALKDIESCLLKNDLSSAEFKDACNRFYTRIPHCCGMKRPPMITSLQIIKRKIDLLETLGEIEIALRTLRNEKEDHKHPLDRHYLALKCSLLPLEVGLEEFKLVETYLLNTHAPTHNLYQMQLQHVFACDRFGENESFNDVGNKMLLWHGSRMTNWYGILSQGLRIAPPEAPCTGYMFGKGVYFADMSSKSANYCYTTLEKNTGILLLCEVSLGKCNDLVSADCEANKLPAGCHSVRGLGKTSPDPSMALTLDNGCVVPLGKPVATGLKGSKSGYTLLYNEYVVYDTRQIRAKYAVLVKFVYNTKY